MKGENSHMKASLPVTAAAASSIRTTGPDDVFYPSSDGKPMAEDMWGSEAIMEATGDLRAVRPKALVAANILLYPEKGNNKKSMAPEVLVTFGIGTHNRCSYLVWEEGKAPAWVLEIASKSTQAKDRKRRRRDYAEMGVREYWLFDAKGDVYTKGTPRLRGLKLKDGKYHPLDSRVVDGERMIHSEALGLDIRMDGDLLRFRDSATGKDVRRRSEVEADTKLALASIAESRARIAELEAARAEREAANRSAAEPSLAELEARIVELEAALRLSKEGHPHE